MLDLKTILEYGLAFVTLFATVFFLLVFLENKDRVRESPKPPKKLPSLTILIPAFNEEKTIAATLESALQAQWPGARKKIVVIDDGSTDATLKIARSYAKKGVLVLHQKNAGKGRALNNGLKHADTVMVATMDSDSYMEKDALLKLVGYFADSKVAAATPLMKVWQPKNTLEKFQRIEYLLTVFSRKLLSFINGINVTPGPLSMFRKSVFDHVGGYDERNILEDQEMAMRIQAYQYKIASSMDAVVYTAVPESLSDLIGQRVRWHRGGIRNILKHYYLVSPRYGDFGILVMPLAILSIFSLFLVFGLALYSLLTGAPNLLLSYGIEGVWFGLKPLHVLSAIILASSVVWCYVGIRQLQGETLSAPFLALYLILYAPLITLFWLVTAFKEIKGEKLRW
ncbi:glycosyltransferase family 2 protein [Candidatus Micrarchaeota archaeon]|nr:glycosyltransferase family 2 protein [Candidatus Micrarchaeota archaeon]